MAIIKWEKPLTRGSNGRQMGKDEISINYVGKGSCTLTFNQHLNDEIEAKGITHLSIQQEDTTGEIYLVLGKGDGLTLSKTGFKKDKEDAKRYNYRISCKAWIVRLMSELKLPLVKSRNVIKITCNLAKREDYMTFRIIGK